MTATTVSRSTILKVAALDGLICIAGLGTALSSFCLSEKPNHTAGAAGIIVFAGNSFLLAINLACGLSWKWNNQKSVTASN